MNIVKNLDKNSKKRDLGGGSNPEEEKKKIRDGSSASITDNCDVFEEGLESPECKEILFRKKEKGKIFRKKYLKFSIWRRIRKICRLEVTNN